MSDNTVILKDIIKNIGKVGTLSSDELLQISYDFFKKCQVV